MSLPLTGKSSGTQKAESEKMGGQTTPVDRGPGIIWTHEIQDVHESLAGYFIGLHLAQKFGERGIVVIAHGTSEAGRCRDPTSEIGLGDPGEQSEGVLGVTAFHQQLCESHNRWLMTGIQF